jgi:hypothetical protein
MMRLAPIYLIGAMAFSMGCGGAAHNDMLTDGGTSCPDMKPVDGAACSQAITCEYGHSSCCGTDYSFSTCSCQNGQFQCTQTVACNIHCPGDAGH